MRHLKKLATAILLLAATTALAAIRGPGPVTGVVIFDRWDGCILSSGWTVHYISEKIKGDLRASAAKAVLITATEVDQPVNPGDELISKFTGLSPAPAAPPSAAALPGSPRIASVLQFKTSLASKVGELPVLKIDIVNASKSPWKAQRLQVGPTLLTKFDHTKLRLSPPADGPSIAAITRVIIPLGDWSRAGLPERTVKKGYFYSYAGTMSGVPATLDVRDDPRLHQPLTLAPGETLSLTCELEAPAGEYDFLAGASDPDLVASNLTTFDIDNAGKTKPVTIKGRP